MTATGEEFVKALANKDAAGLAALLDDNVSFMGLTPRRVWEASTPAEVCEIVFGHWFEPKDTIDEVTNVDIGEDVGDQHRIGYRFDVSNADGPHVVEQQAYYRELDGRITYVRLVCSGWRPRA